MRKQNGFYGSLNGTELYEMPLGASDYAADQEEAAQRSKCNSFLNSKPFYLLNGFYAFCVSLLFAGFAARRAHNSFQVVGYAIASFLMNAPMAYFFTVNAFEDFYRLRKKKEPLFIAAAVMAFSLAIGTSVAGWEIAVEIEKEFKRLRRAVGYILAILSVWNTFSTRFVGSIHFIYTVMLLVRHYLINRHRVKYAAYYELLDDLKNHGNRLKNSICLSATPGIPPRQLLVHYLTQLYSRMSQEGLRPGITWKQFGSKSLLVFGTILIISVFIINMQPLWLNLTVEGFLKVGLKGWSKSAAAVWYAATSNEFFYISSGIKFLPSLISISKIAGAKTRAAFNNANGYAKKGLIAGAALASIVGWAMAAYYSGGGFAKDAQDAVRSGFSPIPNKTYLKIRPFGLWAMLFIKSGFYDSIVAAGAAGLIVNGGAALRFVQSKIPFFKAAETQPEHTFGNKQAIELLEDALDHADIDALDKLGVKDVAHHARKHAGPIPTLWQSMKHCVGFGEDSAAQPLMSPQQPSVHAV